MRTTEEYIELIASHAEELQTKFGITSMRLFGSVARGDHHEGSDVDIEPQTFFQKTDRARWHQYLYSSLET